MEEDLQDKPTEMPDFHRVADIIRRRRWQFLLPFFGGWLLVWGISWFLPSVYQSATLIIVEQPAVPEKLVASNIDLDIQRQLDSITQQILSRTRLMHIIESLNLYTAERKHKSPDELVEEMRKDIDIELVRGDDKKLSAFNITDSNPKQSADSRRVADADAAGPRLAQSRQTAEHISRIIAQSIPHSGAWKIGGWWSSWVGGDR